MNRAVGETSMSGVPVDEPPGVTAAKREGFWHRLAQTLDQHFADRSVRAVPAATLRRSKHDIDRCRRLMHKIAPAPIGANFATSSRKRADRAHLR
jgi:hypothetical protein